MATNLGTAVGYLTLDIEGFTKGIDNATRQMDRMGSGGSSVLESMGTAATKAGTALTAAVTAPIVGFGASAIREGVAFEEAMKQVKNVANLANSNIDTFREAVKELGFQMTETGDDAESMYRTMYEYAIRQGSETRYTAEEVADALYYMGLAGWDATKMMQGLRPMLDLGAATGEDLARVSDIVTDSMNALGIEVKDLSSYTNVLAEMTRSSNTTLDQAGEAFKYVAPLAGSLGYSMQDMAIAIGEFANVGVKGSQAGTGLRQALNSLTNPSERAKKVLDDLGWSIYDVGTGKAKPLMQVMTELRTMFRETMDLDDMDIDQFMDFWEWWEKNYRTPDDEGEGFFKMSDREFLDYITEWTNATGKNTEMMLTQFGKVSDVIKLVGVRALPGMLGIINATEDNFNTLTKSVYGADEAYNGLGTAVGMSDELMDSGQGSIYKLTSSISELKIQLYDLLGGPFREIVDKLTDLVRKFNEMDESTQRNIIHWAGIAAAVGPALLIFGKLLTGIAQITSAFKLAGLSKDGFAKNVTGTLMPALDKGEGGAGKLGTAIGKLGNFFKDNIKNIGGVIGVLGGVTLSFKSMFEGLSQGGFGVQQVLESVLGNVLTFGGLLLAGVETPVAALIALGITLVTAIIGNWDTVKSVISTVWNFLGEVGNKIIDFVKGFAKGVWDLIKELFSWLSGALDNFVNLIFEVIPALFDSIWNFLGNIGNKIIDFVKSVVADLWDSIKTFFSWVIDAIKNFGDLLFNVIPTIIGDIWNSISSFFSSIFNGIKNLMTDVVGAILAGGSVILTGIGNVFSSIGSGIAGLASVFMGIFTGLLSSVMGALSSIGSAVGGFINTIVSLVANTVSTVAGFISGLAASIGSTLNGIFTIMSGFFTSFANGLNNVLKGIGDWVKGVVSELGGFIQSLWDGITSIVSGFGSGIGEVLTTIGSGISSVVKDVGGGLAKFLTDIGGTIATGISGIIGKLGSGFSGIWDSVVEIGKNIIEGIFEGIKSGVEWVGEKIGSVCSGIVDGIKKFFKIESPSKVMADEVGRWLPPGIAEGFEDAVPEAEDDINDSVEGMIDNINTEDAMINIGTSYNDLQTVMADSYTYFADSVETTEDRLNASLDNMYTKMYDLYMLEQQLNAGVVGSTGYEMTPAITPGSGSTPGGNTTNNAGNTFIFNSPKPIDEIEAARQMEKTQREMEEGFI